MTAKEKLIEWIIQNPDLCEDLGAIMQKQETQPLDPLSCA